MYSFMSYYEDEVNLTVVVWKDTSSMVVCNEAPTPLDKSYDSGVRHDCRRSLLAPR